MAIIARLAVDRSIRGTGLGIHLLDFAPGRCLMAREEVGMRAVVVDAIDQRAAGFYERFGFTPVQGAPLRLMVPMSALRRAFEGLPRTEHCGELGRAASEGQRA